MTTRSRGNQTIQSGGTTSTTNAVIRATAPTKARHNADMEGGPSVTVAIKITVTAM